MQVFSHSFATEEEEEVEGRGSQRSTVNASGFRDSSTPIAASRPQTSTPKATARSLPAVSSSYSQGGPEASVADGERSSTSRGDNTPPQITYLCVLHIFFKVGTTVKAPNFGPHGNVGPLFQKGLLSLKRILQKNEENKSCRKTLDVQICFCSYFLHDSSKEATELAKKGPKFP